MIKCPLCLSDKIVYHPDGIEERFKTNFVHKEGKFYFETPVLSWDEIIEHETDPVLSCKNCTHENRASQFFSNTEEA